MDFKESVLVVEWLRDQLQQTNNFTSKTKADWVIELNAIITELKRQDFVVVQPNESFKQAESRMRQPLDLNKIKNILKK